MSGKTIINARPGWQFEAAIPAGVGTVVQMMEYNGGVYMLTSEHFILSYEKVDGVGRVRILEPS